MKLGKHGGGIAEEVVKKLQALRLDDPTLKSMEKIAQAAHPLAETLRAIEHSLVEFKRLEKAIQKRRR